MSRVNLLETGATAFAKVRGWDWVWHVQTAENTKTKKVEREKFREIPGIHITQAL